MASELAAAARLGDAYTLFGNPEMVKYKLAERRGHCEAEGRNYGDIERTNTIGFLRARDATAVAAKRERLAFPEPCTASPAPCLKSPISWARIATVNRR